MALRCLVDFLLKKKHCPGSLFVLLTMPLSISPKSSDPNVTLFVAAGSIH